MFEILERVSLTQRMRDTVDSTAAQLSIYILSMALPICNVISHFFDYLLIFHLPMLHLCYSTSSMDTI